MCARARARVRACACVCVPCVCASCVRACARARRYASGTGSTVCSPCAANSFSPSPGASQCTACPAGSQSHPGAWACRCALPLAGSVTAADGQCRAFLGDRTWVLAEAGASCAQACGSLSGRNCSQLDVIDSADKLALLINMYNPPPLFRV